MKSICSKYWHAKSMTLRIRPEPSNFSMSNNLWTKTKMKQVKKSKPQKKYSILAVRCAEHTFQLGIRDALKKGRPEKFPSKIRKITQFLRSFHTDIVLKRRADKSVLIDMATQRGSTYLMPERLLELK